MDYGADGNDQVMRNEFLEFGIYPNPTSSIHAGDDELVPLSLAFCHEAQSLCTTQPQPYIWSGEGFPTRLRVLNTCLKGRQVLGESPDDLWYSTWVLFQLSTVFPEVVITGNDCDGEYLLIEAAKELPDWLEPDTSKNRVFIHQGSLHIIDIKHLGKPSLREALALIRMSPEKTVASENIQKVLRARMEQSLKQPLHRAQVLIPEKLASILQSNPQFLSPILSILNDATDVAIASDLGDFRGLQADGALTLTPIRLTFSQLGYAQLLSSDVQSPNCYPMASEDDPSYLALLTGSRLSLGAQLLALQCQQSESVQVHPMSEAAINILGTRYSLSEEIVKSSLQSVSEQLQHSLLASALSQPSSINTFDGPDDSLDWLEDVFSSYLTEEVLEQKFGSLQLSEAEQREVVERMLEDENKTSRFDKKLQEILSNYSSFEGAEGKSPASANTDNTDSDAGSEFDTDTESSGDDNVDSEDDENLLEMEIMEAIHSDPDLLMKIIEKSEVLGLDIEDLMARLRSFKPVPTSVPVSEQNKKGLADIDPVKVTEARQTSRRPLANDDSKGKDSASTVAESSSGDEDYYEGDDSDGKPLAGTELHSNEEIASSESEDEL